MLSLAFVPARARWNADAILFARSMAYGCMRGTIYFRVGDSRRSRTPSAATKVVDRDLDGLGFGSVDIASMVIPTSVLWIVLPVLGLWFASPWIGHLLSQPIVSRVEPLSAEDQA